MIGRTGTILVVCLAVVLVGPAFGELMMLATDQPASCSSAHACCRRAGTKAACPHEMAATEDGDCSRPVCVLRCADRHDDGTVPVVLIGFSPESVAYATRPATAALPSIPTDSTHSIIRLPLTPPPRTLSAA